MKVQGFTFKGENDNLLFWHYVCTVITIAVGVIDVLTLKFNPHVLP